MVTVTLDDQQYQLGDAAVQRLLDEAEQLKEQLARLDLALVRVDSLDSLRQLQQLRADARIDELLATPSPDDRVVRMLETWTDIREIRKLPLR